MPALPRVLQKIFGGNSSNNGQPGSARAGTFNLTNNVGTLQALPAWENGWNDITLTGSRLPCLEEDQAINYVVTSQIAYILQRGIPEYDATTTYFQNCVAIESGTVKLYKSLTADNVGNALSDPVNWQLLVDFDAIVTPPFNNYAATTDPTVNDDSGDGYSPGSIWYNSTGTGEAFLCTDATVGAAKWIKTTLTVDELGSAAFVNTGTTNGTVPLIGAGDKIAAALLPIGTDIQAFNARLSALAGLSPSNGDFPFFTGSTTMSTVAMMTASAVGTYCFAERTTGAAALNPGSTIGGADLSPTTAAATNSGVLTGTWQCMGHLSASGTGGNAATLFQRIA